MQYQQYQQQPQYQQPGMYPQQPGMGGFNIPPDVVGFREIMRGQGIDPNEFYNIVNCANFAYKAKQTPLSTAIANAIKAAIKGNWFVVTHPVGTQYDYALTLVKSGDFFCFSIENQQFGVCRVTI